MELWSRHLDQLNAYVLTMKENDGEERVGLGVGARSGCVAGAAVQSLDYAATFDALVLS
jgi:hypothetical protein